MSALLGSLSNAIALPGGGNGGSNVGTGLSQPVTNVLDNAVDTVGNAVTSVKPLVGDLRGSLDGVLGDVGLDGPRTPFEKCIARAFGEDASLYSFPGDLLYDLPLVESLPYLNNLESEHPYNLDYPVTPAAIVFPKDAQQVSAAVVCAHEYGIAVQSRSGGHSYCNHGLGGNNGSLSIDYQNMKAFSYNQQDQTMTFESGNRLGDLDRQLAPTGRVAAYGQVSDIGSGGHFTIGGLAPLSRLLGLAADQIVSAECVLADGTITTVSANENPDLFFAIKGAAWSFTTVTSFTVATSPSPTSVISYQYNITFSQIADLADSFSRWQDLISQPDLTRKFASTLTLAQDLLVYSGTFFGDEQEFNRLNLEAILPFGQEHLGITVVSSVVTHAITDLINLGYDVLGSVPAHFYIKSLKYTRQTLLPPRAVQELFQYIDSADKGTLIWFIVWDLGGGAIADIPQTATAYWHRDSLYFQQAYVVSAVGPVTRQSHEFLSGLTEEVQRLAPGIDDSAYAGYVDAELRDPLTAYWGGNVERLTQIKGEYDPDDVFRNPQSIPSPYKGAGRQGQRRSVDGAEAPGRPLNGAPQRLEGRSDGALVHRHVHKRAA